MINFPKAIDHNQSLYCVIPLTLDIADTNSYIHHIDTFYGDCQLFTHQDLNSNYFSYNDEDFFILSDFLGYDAKRHNTKSRGVKKCGFIPFSALLIGPSYACKEVMKNFSQWAVQDKNTNSLLCKQGSKSSAKKNTIMEDAIWAPVDTPSVWAQATFASVTITSCFPTLLEKELRRILDFPVVVHAVHPRSNILHNEFCAWLTAIYTLVAARNLHRTVFSHSHMWSSQLQLFFDLNANPPYFSNLWTPFINFPTIYPQNRRLLSTKIANRARKISQYKQRKESYAHNKLPITRIIGIGLSEHPTALIKENNKKIVKQALTLDLEYSKTHAIIYIPINANIHITENLKIIAANNLALPKNVIEVQYIHAKSIFYNKEDSYYPILCNLLLDACNGMPKKTKKLQVVSSNTERIISYIKGIACVVLECRVNQVDKRMFLYSVELMLDVGYVANKDYFFGYIEDIIFTTCNKLFGNRIEIDRDIQIRMDFIGAKEKSRVSNLFDIVSSAIFHAVKDAFKFYEDARQDNAQPMKKMRSKNEVEK